MVIKTADGEVESAVIDGMSDVHVQKLIKTDNNRYYTTKDVLYATANLDLNDLESLNAMMHILSSWRP